MFSSPWYFVKSTQNQKDKFETLCRVKADLSAAPYTSRYTAEGKVCYKREYDVILLVGLTELKAQASWIDTITVRAHHPMRVRLPHPTPMYATPEDREKVCSAVL